MPRAVAGDGGRGEFQFLRLVHQPVQTAGAIEQRILGVQMQMDKIGVRHGGSLTSNPEDTKTQLTLPDLAKSKEDIDEQKRQSNLKQKCRR